jgi:hypothetical protein
MPGPLAAVAGRMLASTVGRGVAKSATRGAVMRSASNMGHGVSSGQFSSPEPQSSAQPSFDSSGPDMSANYHQSGSARW